MRKGIGVSPGVAVGTAYCIHEIFVNPNTRRLAEAEVLPELDRYEKARDATAADLRALHAKITSQVGPDQAAIFLAHESILHDPALTEKIRHWIVDERQSAPAALHNMLGEYTSLFAQTKDDYIKERLADVRDVVVRLSGHLSEVLHADAPAIDEPLILVADELLPSQVVMLGDREVRHCDASRWPNEPCSHFGSQSRDSCGLRRSWLAEASKKRRRPGRRRP